MQPAESFKDAVRDITLYIAIQIAMKRPKSDINIVETRNMRNKEPTLQS